MSAAQPTICFVAPQSYGVLSGDADVEHIGGAEVQQVLVARELVRRGYGVRFVVNDYGQPDAVDCGGIAAFKKCRAGAGLPWVRRVYPGTTSLWSAMSRAAADVYYQRGAGSETGQVAAWCQLHGKAFVFACANDTDCDPALPALETFRERASYRFGLRRAAVVVSQTEFQQQRYRSGFQLETRRIRSCTEEPPPAEIGTPARRDHRRVLWVGRVSYQKRPELLLDVATRCPDYNFDVVGAANAPTHHTRSVLQRAAAMSNITLHGRVPFGQIGAFYGRAAVLLCTSRREGYPNAFLEAWARGVPTLSTVDPDGVIERHGLGRLADGGEGLAQACRELVEDATKWSAAVERVRQFYLEHHTVAQGGDAYAELLDGLGPRREYAASSLES